MSDSLVARQGPLAHVWLASNYDKKLSKQQFLNTDIVISSRIISGKQLQSGSNDNENSNTITLRLSGQLLLGIVRIYSRKTKYLLDDIQEVLYKLKNSFKSASGATIGAATANLVNLPAKKTTLANLDRVTLEDQVTNFDLFYQEDLVLDDEPSIPTADSIFSQMSVGPNRADDSQFDLSMEVARGTENEDLDLDLNLDFDLDSDHSIEVGRDAQTALHEHEQSLMDIDPKPAAEAAPEFDLEPLETIDIATAPTPAPEPTPARRLVGFSESGVVKTAKRKLVVDSAEELERGLPNEVLRNIQNMQTNGQFAQESLTLKLTQQEKLDLINELASAENPKRRRIWNLDSQLRQRCLELSREEEAPAADAATPETTRDFDTSIDFDLSLPDVDLQASPEPLQSAQEESSQNISAENPKATSQIAAHLRDAFYEKPSIEFADLMKEDLKSSVPLGVVEQQDRQFKYSEKKEATKCFFELLVLASHDCVTLEQTHTDNQVATDLQVRPRDNLATQFV